MSYLRWTNRTFRPTTRSVRGPVPGVVRKRLRLTLPVEETDGEWLRIAINVETTGGSVSDRQILRVRRPEANKRQVTMRFDADVLEFFKRRGHGWQGRMNAVLRSFMEQQGRRR